MNQYETVFILTPVLSEAQTKEAVQRYKDLILANGGEMINEEFWGMRKLAYPIQKKTTGFYNLFEFKADPSFIAKLETAYRRDEMLLRFLTFKMEKYAIKYSETRRNKVKSEEAAKEN